MIIPTPNYSSLFLYILVIFLSLHEIKLVSVGPTWLTNSYVQASSKKVIDGDSCSCTTGSSATPTATMTFATPFSAVPNLGYGVSNYQGNDYMMSEMFQVNRTGLTATSFSVLVKISGITNIWVIQVRYIAISKSFPHHLNSFDNVPVNYTFGPLVNISTASMSLKTFTNTINYATQASAAGSNYTQFSLPLSNNKILLFITSLYHSGSHDMSGTSYPLNLSINATPMSTTTYKFYVQFSVNAAITRLHFSMITFDRVDVQSSGQYLLVYDKICYTVNGGFYPFPAQFLSNFMVGFVEFSAPKTASSMHYISNFTTINGSYGIQMPKSQPRNTNIVPFSRFCFTYFYIKTWLCPSATFYDDGTKMCITCQINNCVDCFNSTHCQICDESNRYFINITTGTCQTCIIPGCINCSSLTTCHDCDENMNYVHSNGSCILCNTSSNYFADHNTHTCVHCTLPHCTTCQTLFECLTCDTANSYYLNPSQVCIYCDPSHNQFLDPITLHCDVCEIDNCVNCSSMATCRQCNQTDRYFLNTTDSQCYICTAAYCDVCLNITVCNICAPGYTINPLTLLCQVCTLVGCVNCTDTLTCAQCNQTQNYTLLNNGTCQLCTGGTFPNITAGTCDFCTLTQCTLCVSLVACSICNSNNSYYLTPSLVCIYCDPISNNFINQTTLDCQTCTLFQCLNCSNLIACSLCNSSAGYVLNMTTNLCQLCPSNLFINTTSLLCQPCTVPHCTACITLTTCSLCDSANSYYLINSTDCGYCDPVSDTFINLTSLGCVVCSIPNCINCTSLTQCQQCNSIAGYFVNLTDYLCYPCTIPNCVACQTLYLCSLCNSSAGYVLNMTTNLCQLCPSNLFINTTSLLCQPCTVPHCTACITLTTCSLCDSANSYYLINSTDCGYCDPVSDTFINLTSLGCVVCSIPNCINCTSLTQCQQCNSIAGYFVNLTDYLCYPCTIPNCVACQTLYLCSLCNSSAGYVLNMTTNLCQLCPSNLFINTTSLLCQPCTVPHCTACITLTTCSLCDSANSYYLINSTDCGYCDPVSDTFINLTSLGCVVCSIPNCINCTSLTQCQQCNSIAGYFVNLTDYLCYPCTIPNCVACQTLYLCSLCNSSAGYVLNMTTNLCQLCPSNLFINTTSLLCQPCTVPHCTACITLTTCSLCDSANSYYLINSTDCGYCDPVSDTFINLTSLGCVVCSIPNCINCTSLTQCQQCNSIAGYFVNLTDYLCYPCTIPNCVACQTLYLCSLCNSSAGYVLNMTTNLCQLCPSNLFINTTSLLCQPCTVPHCTACITLTTCSLCDSANSYYLINSTDCGYCDPVSDTFINLTSLGCVVCSIPNCINCTSLTQCQQCNSIAGYFVNLTDYLCYPCTIPNCVACQTLYLCSLCNQTQQYFQQDGQCVRCNLTGCLNCTSLSTCIQCDTINSYNFSYINSNICGQCNQSCMCDGYTIPWIPSLQKCTPICGDGLLRANQNCDDNNTISGDGCSTTCTIEKYWTCDTSQPSICNQITILNAQFLSIEKVGCNSFKIITRVPQFTLEQIQANIIILNQQIKITSKEQNGNQILIYAEYKRDIANQIILLQFSPIEVFNITYNPTIPALYYSENECKIQGQVETMLKAAQIVSYAILIVSILSCKIVGLELFGVLQLSFFTLSSHTFLNQYLAPITKFKTFNGLNIGISSQSSQLPESIQKMGMASSFINNCNIMLFVLFGELLISLGMFITSKIIKNEKLKKLSLRLLKQGFITLVLFNIFNISFSAGLHWKYASPEDSNYLISSIILAGTLLAMVVSVFAMELTAKDDYGQFKNKLKQNWVCRLYIPLTVAYRMALGFYSALKSDYDQGSLLIMAFALAFIMYTIINLPFVDFFQNYRCCLIHFTMLYTLLTTNYYRGMKSTTPLEIKGRIYTPAIIELVLILSSIVISFFVLVYQVYQMIKKCQNKKKVESPTESRQQVNLTQQSFENIH